jgi:phage gpG-like protein
MISLHKKIVLGEDGKPTEVIIPYKEFLELEEMLGMDLEEEVKEHLRLAKKERDLKKKKSYIELDEI